MTNYKKVLVAIDINAEYRTIIDKALAISESPDNLSLTYISLPSAYIQPYLYGADYIEFDNVDRKKRAQEKLHKIAKKFGIADENVVFKIGDPGNEIKNIASEIKADLIVLGTHGRSGFKLLLGSTATSVLHGVEQDVLAVRMKDDE